MKTILTAIFCIFLLGFQADSQPADPLATFKDLASLETVDAKKIKAFDTILSNEKDPANQAKMAFALGVASYKSGNRVLAAGYFTKALELKTHLIDYAQYFLGLIERDNGDLAGAKKHFEAVRA